MTDIITCISEFKEDKRSLCQLNNDLEEAVKQTLQNNSFRIQTGSDSLFWEQFVQVYPTLAQDPDEIYLINLTKFCRNVVAGEIRNQQMAIQYGCLELIENTMLQKMASPSDNTLILQVSTQAVCNMITNNSAALNETWTAWLTHSERGSLWSYILSRSNESLIMSALVLVINCIRGSKERCDLLVSSKIGQDMIAAILGDIERLHENQESRNFELGYTIFSELISFHHFKTLFIRVDDYSSEKEIFPEFIETGELEFLTQQLASIGKQAVQVILTVKEGHAVQQVEDHIQNIYTGIILVLQMVNDLFLLDPPRLKSLLVHINASSLMIDMLGLLESVRLPTAESERPELGFHFLKRECIRLLGTLCYRDKVIQDKIRELGGIPLILCQLKIDDSNPYIREYATLTLRNVLENNPENQLIIQELEAQEVVQTGELDQMGIRPELTEDGKVRIKKL
ncbi:spinocerebellar ataxia type 10 protein domain-containing protein [Choanephora cucurbitarum]|nr:spinocerebellar ataxia type 10 protein domain-containing protein [Choanephora cucurbitarum]